MNIIVAIILNALALLATAYFVPGFHVANFVTALITGIVIGVINAFIRPILDYISAPITVLTLGLFSFVISAVVLYLASLIVPGFTIDSIMAAIIGGVVLAVVAKENLDLMILDLVMPKKDGYFVLGELKRLNIKIPVIVASNLGQKEDIEKAKKLGAIDYFVKSDITLVEMVNKVKQYLH